MRIVRHKEQPVDAERQIAVEVRAVMGTRCREEFEYSKWIEPGLRPVSLHDL